MDMSDLDLKVVRALADILMRLDRIEALILADASQKARVARLEKMREIEDGLAAKRPKR